MLLLLPPNNLLAYQSRLAVGQNCVHMAECVVVREEEEE